MRRCIRRFPVTLVFALALTALLLWLVASDWKGDERLLMTLFYYLSVGTLLSLSLGLWAEELRSRRLGVVVQVVANVLLMADALFLYHCTSGARATEICIAHGAAILAIGLSVFFLPFFRERDDIPAWNFAQTVVGTLALTVIVGTVMSGGLCLLTFSLHQLFGVDVNEKCYLYILIVCSELLPLLMFLGLLPEGEHKHDRRPHPTAFARGTIRYLFLPLAVLYLLVLYVYAATILVRWELPDGWVSWLVTALMAGIIAIEAGLYPSRLKNGGKTDERIARWLPVFALPLLVLMTVGIGRRFLDYGITINRLYLATLNAWFYYLCIGLIVGRARRLSWIPISFSLVFLLTSVLPVNYASITRRVLRNEVREALVNNGPSRLPLSQNAYTDWLSSLPQEQRLQVNDKLRYLADWFGTESTSDLVAEGTSFALLAEEEDEPGTENLHYNQQDNTTVALPTGYTRCTLIDRNALLTAYAPSDSLLVVPLEGMSDTVRLPLDTLRTRDLHPQLPLPPPLFRTQGDRILLLNTFHIYLDKKKPEAEVRLTGYLFSH